MAKTELVKHEDKLPAGAIDYGELAGLGAQEAPRAEVQVTPFLVVLQKGSPQVNQESAVYDPEARPGMLYNTATGQLHQGRPVNGQPTGVEMALVDYEYMFSEWTPRDEGGGFKGLHKPEEPLVARCLKEQGRFKRLQTPDGTELIETIQFALIYGAPTIRDNPRPALLACTSTKLTPAKRFYSRCLDLTRELRAPSWALKWRLGTVHEERSAGDSYNVRFDLLATDNVREALIAPDDPVFAMAHAFYKSIRAGELKADYQQSAGTSEDVPF